MFLPVSMTNSSQDDIGVVSAVGGVGLECSSSKNSTSPCGGGSRGSFVSIPTDGLFCAGERIIWLICNG